MNPIPANAGAPQQAPQLKTRAVVQFSNDNGKTYESFSDVSTGPVNAGASASGFGIDLNGDGQHNAGNDGYLVLDFDGDGKYTAEEVSQTNRYLKALNGETDLNGDGRVSFDERSEARHMVQMNGSADLDQDEVIQGWELSELGAKVVTFNGDGSTNIVNIPGFEEGRQPYRPPGPGGPGGGPNYEQHSAEITARGQQQMDFWSGMLGIDLGSALGQFDFTNGMPSFGGGGGMPSFQQPFMPGVHSFQQPFMTPFGMPGMMPMDPMSMMMFGGGGGMFGSNPNMFTGMQSSLMMLNQITAGMPQVPSFAAGF